MTPATSDRSAIELRDVHVRAGGRDILNVPNLCVKCGETVVLMGPNGAGKTTLFRTMLAMQSGVVGHVAVLGCEMVGASRRERAGVRRRIGTVAQHVSWPSELPMTVREVVATGLAAKVGWLRRVSTDDHRCVSQWIDRLGLSACADRRYTTLSGGEQRKVMIARAMVTEPELLLLDEPGAGLDVFWRQQLLTTIAEVCRTMPLTLVLSAHEVEMIPATCDRAILLSAGSIVADGPIASVMSRERLNAVYGCDMELIEMGSRRVLLQAEGGR